MVRALGRVGVIRPAKIVRRVGKIISLELLAKRKGAKHGCKG